MFMETSPNFGNFESDVPMFRLDQDLPPGWEVVTSKSTGKQWHGMAGGFPFCHGGTPKSSSHQTISIHFSIETHGDLGIPHF